MKLIIKRTLYFLAAIIAFQTVWAEAKNSDGAQAEVDLDNLPVNRWIRVKPTYLPAPDGGKHLPSGWNKLVYDPVGKRAVYMDRWKDDLRNKSIYANAVMAFDVVSNVVECVKLTNWKRQSLKGGGYRTVPLPQNAKEPTPCDRHPYGNMAFVPYQQALYLSAGANRTAYADGRRGHSICRDTWRLDMATQRWKLIGSEKNPPQKLEDVMAYDAANKVIVALVRGGAQTWLLDVETGQWRNALAKNNPHCGMGAAMCYDAKRERVMVIGGAGKKGSAWNEPHREVYAYSVEDNTWTRLADVPVPVRAMGAAYDTRRDKVLVHAGRGKNPFFFGFYCPEKDTWQPLDLPEDAPLPTPAWHTLTYDTANDVFIRAAGPWSDPQWWIFRPDIP
ncbi:MAG: kelch repeat-containing protein [Verrucomicrobiota bacterium]